MPWVRAMRSFCVYDKRKEDDCGLETALPNANENWEIFATFIVYEILSEQ